MKIIQKYILFEILPIFAIGNVFFVFLLLLDKLVDLADLFFTRNVPGYLIIETVVYYLPSFLIITVPTSVLLATLIGFSRLSSDSEIIVLKASGASGKVLVTPAIIFGILACIFSLSMSTWLMPIGNRLAIENLTKIAKNISVNDIKSNELYQDIPGMVIFVNKKDKAGALHNVIVIDKKRGSISSSKSGEIVSTDEGGLLFSLKEGRIISSQQDGYSAVSFKKFMINIPIEISASIEKISERFMTLKSLIKHFPDGDVYKNEFSTRFALPLAAIVMAVLGMSLGAFFSRTGKSFGIFIAVFMVFFYNAIFIMSKSVDWINPFVSPWIANFCFTVLAYFYYRKVSK